MDIWANINFGVHRKESSKHNNGNFKLIVCFISFILNNFSAAVALSYMLIGVWVLCALFFFIFRKRSSTMKWYKTNPKTYYFAWIVQLMGFALWVICICIVFWYSNQWKKLSNFWNNSQLKQKLGESIFLENMNPFFVVDSFLIIFKWWLCGYDHHFEVEKICTYFRK